MATVQVLETPAQTQTVKDEATGCCIVGGGPAGAMLVLLLARRGVRVTLLEMHHDFDREFRVIDRDMLTDMHSVLRAGDGGRTGGRFAGTKLPVM